MDATINNEQSLAALFQKKDAPGDGIRILENTPGDAALLKRGLNELFPANFPPGEAEEAIELVDKLTADRGEPTGSRYMFLMAGDHLDDPNRAKIKGISIGIYFPR